MKKITLQDGSVRFVGGRKRPVARGPRLELRRYLDLGSLPPLPVSVDYSPAARVPLSQAYLNDQLGDCVVAAMAHLVGLFTGNAGAAPVVFTQQQIIALYSAIGGYVPGNQSTDLGCNEQDALSFWMNHGAPIGSHQIAGWLAVDPNNLNEVKAAAYLFENLFFGIELPDAWTTISSSGFVWDAGTPDPQNGHAVISTGYNAQGIQIDTWGLIGTMTWPALARDVIAQSGGELYTVISQDVINRATNKTPAGLNWQQLVSDFDAIGGHLPIPSPSPAPAPAPAPAPVPPAPSPAPGVPTKAQVLAAIQNAINGFSWPA